MKKVVSSNIYKEVSRGGSYISFYKKYENVRDLAINLDGIKLKYFDEFPDAVNKGYTGYLFDKKDKQIGFVKVSNEFLEKGAKGEVLFFFATEKETLDYWNNGEQEVALKARETNKAFSNIPKVPVADYTNEDFDVLVFGDSEYAMPFDSFENLRVYVKTNCGISYQKSDLGEIKIVFSHKLDFVKGEINIRFRKDRMNAKGSYDSKQPEKWWLFISQRQK